MQKPNLKTNIDLSTHTYFGIKTTASLMFQPNNTKELASFIKHAKKNKIKYTLLGNGSNILFANKKYNGCIIKLNNLSKITETPPLLNVEAGVTINQLLNHCIKNSYAGLEFLAGIPATIGGSVFCNAGAFNNHIGEFVESINILNKDGEIKTIKKNKLRFSYRKSNIKGIILSVDLKLNKSSKKEVLKKINEYLEYRKKTQPLNQRSAGCTFKNPTGPSVPSAGHLIDSCNLKGLTVGNAKISEKHANFIINKKNALPSDILKLMDIIKRNVKEKHNIELKTEIRIIK